MYKESKISLFGKTYSSISSPASSNDASTVNDEYEESESNADFEGMYVTEEDAIDTVLRDEAYCFDLTKFSSKLVDATFSDAVKQLTRKKKVIKVVDIVRPLVDDIFEAATCFQSSSDFSRSPPSQYDRHSYSEYESSEIWINWPKISDFNIKMGLDRLEDYVSTWKRSKDWFFCVEFLGFESDDCSNIFVYEVEWSKPTKTYPIPQTTASVYFALEVLKMVPYTFDRCIDVSYVFESSNVIHVPGKINFQENWLEAIIEAKLKIFKSITFSVPRGICPVPDNVSDSESIKWK